MEQNKEFLELINKCIENVEARIELALQLSVKSEVDYTYQRVKFNLNLVKEVLNAYDLSVQHINRFTAEIGQIQQSFSDYLNYDLSEASDEEKERIRIFLENKYGILKTQIELFEFNIDFFSKLGFFNKNIVAIGANGSGKTTLSNQLKSYLPQTAGIVISAQKVLIIPTFGGVSNFEQTHQKLSESQKADKSFRVTYSSLETPYVQMQKLTSEFQLLLDNLLAERNAARNNFFKKLTKGESPDNLPKSKLDLALEIWNSLIQHRIMECDDGINITLRNLDGDSPNYAAHLMSDGEKVSLYLIAQVLQAPESGFIIIDEPEMYLHKTILTKLWDTLENLRKDCIFVYLTHDLEFATSRISAKKVWIRSFTPPSNWLIENIPDHDLPEPLLLELLGSRKDILFCEGGKGSIDEKTYNILFPIYTVIPAESCLSVIAYVKAFNKIQNLNTKAIGIIDSDYHKPERLEALQTENIFSFNMPEIENLFLDENFLAILADHLLIEDKQLVIEKIKKEVMFIFENEIELQVSNYITSKINYYFNDSHICKGNTSQEVQDNYNNFTDFIDIPKWYQERKDLLEIIVKDKSYTKALSVFNNKGLKRVVNKHFNITDSSDRSVKLLLNNTEAQNVLCNYFPDGL